jgi:CBS domain-containing protein
VRVNQPYLLAAQAGSLPPLSLRSRSRPPRLLPTDPAVRAMHDFLHDAPHTIAEDASVEDVMDLMFQHGVRAFLVVRELSVVGLITAEDTRGTRDARRARRRVADLMTPTIDVPAIDWQTLQDARVGDLVDIFEGSGVRHLVVMQTQTATWSTVRGLIHRQRMERQLRS